MNAKLLMLSAAPVTALLLAAPAAAQQQDRDRQQPQRQTDRMDQQREAHANYVLAGTVRGKDVVNRQGEDLGDITDLIVDVERGTTPYAIVSFGGVLGIARDSVAVPMRAFEWDAQEDRLVLEVTREQLEAAPEFDEDNWDQLHDENWQDQIRQAFGQIPGMDRDRDTRQPRDRQQFDPDRQQQDRMQQQRDQRRQAARPGRDGEEMKPYMLVSDLKGATVVGSGGEDIGRIDDVIIKVGRASGQVPGVDRRDDGIRDQRDRQQQTEPDRQQQTDRDRQDQSTGQIAFVTVRSGGVLGIGADNHLVPWEALTRVENDEFTLMVPNGRLDDAPRLESDDEIQRLNDQRFRDRIYQHYQVQPREADRHDGRQRDGRTDVPPTRPGG